MTHEDYFKELKEQILIQNKWDNENFIVFSHEAGTGKSRQTHRILAEMTKEHDYRVLYVQLFVKNEELVNTVNAINQYAGKEVAWGIAGDDIRKKKHRQQAVESQCLCVPHRMYQMICKGEHRELVKDRDILIIDEYPNLLEKVTLSCQDIGDIFVTNDGDDCHEIDELAIMLRKVVGENQKKCKTNTEMVFLDFRLAEYERFKMIVKKLIKTSKKEQIERLKKVQQILANGAYFYEGGLHTFDSSCELFLRKRK
ncbi:DEAD/DEAH box helicase family protein, partial [Neobacillus fumarioli]|uniref:DEAD/DEAH box helicase family protein n=1 Tax=Neobacillus fumarioli TaxID=105229 RepID=UPI000AF3571B